MFSASGRVITFHGFLKAYVEGRDDEGDPDSEWPRRPGDPAARRRARATAVNAAEINASGHQTKPPARYTEATLIRELEEREIGRPSTYASIIGTILNRGYVYKKGTALVPAWLAFSVIRLLEEHFSRLVSYEFTAGMEDVLDEIAEGRRDRNTELAEFYFGSGDVEGLKQLVTELGEIDARELATFPIAEGVDLRVGRYGPYVETAGRHPRQRARRPAARRADRSRRPRSCWPTRPVRRSRSARTRRPGCRSWRRTAATAPTSPRCCPRTRRSRRRPRTGSLFKSMNLDTITLEDALTLLTLPRVVGVDPETGDEITAQNGRYGPYLKKGTDSRSIDSEEKLLTITLEEAQAIYAQPKRRGRAAADPGREIGTDPVSGNPVTMKSGRFGTYVTDGEYNATLRQGDDEATLTIERAAELLAERRAKGPAKKAAKKTAKKTAKKSAKKTTRRRPAKKTTPRRPPRRPRRPGRRPQPRRPAERREATAAKRS